MLRWSFDRSGNRGARTFTLLAVAITFLIGWQAASAAAMQKKEKTVAPKGKPQVTKSSTVEQLLVDGALHAGAGKHSEAEVCYRQALKLLGAKADAKSELSTTYLLAKAIVAQEELRPAEAADMLHQVLQKHRVSFKKRDEVVKAAHDMLIGQMTYYVWMTCGTPDAEKATLRKALVYAERAMKLGDRDYGDSIGPSTFAFAQYRNGKIDASYTTMRGALATGACEQYPGQWFVMAQIEHAKGNTQAAKDWYIAGCRWMFKTSNTWEPLTILRDETAELTGVEGTFPPEGFLPNDCYASNERLLEEYPDVALLLSYRAAHLASAEHWKQAMDELRRATKLKPDEFRHLEELTAIELYTNADAVARTKSCRRVIDRFLAKTNIHQVIDNVILCSLPGNAHLDRQQLLAAAQKAAAENDNDTNPQFKIGPGLALYRAGQYQDALDTLPPINEDAEAWNSPFVILFRAMAEYQLGNRDEAKKLLAKGREQIEANHGSPRGEFTKWRSRPTGFCLTRIALQEAETLIENPTLIVAVGKASVAAKRRTARDIALPAALQRAAIHVLANEHDQAELLYRAALNKVKGQPRNELRIALLLAQVLKAQSAQNKEIAELLHGVIDGHGAKLEKDDEHTLAATSMMRTAMNWYVWATCNGPDQDKQDYAEALKYAQFVRTLSENDAKNGLWTVSLAQLRLGDFEKARNSMKQSIKEGIGQVWPGQWFIMSMIEAGLGNEQAAQDWHAVGCHWMDKARNTFAPAMNLRKQTAEITGLGESYPPAEWSKADFRAAVKRLTAGYPEIARLIYMRGTQRAAEKNWKDALSDFQQAAELNPENFRYAEACAALTLFQGGAQEARTKLCQQLIDEWMEGGNPSRTMDVIVLCCLANDAKVDRELILKTAIDTREIQQNRHYLRMAEGAAQFRCGNYKEAIEVIPDIDLYASTKDVLLALVFRAMSHHQLGETDVSKQLLAQARELETEYLPSPDGAMLQWQDRPVVWSIVQMAFREAEALIEKKK